MAAAAGASERPKLKCLCLHGYLQNAEVFRSKSGSFRKALKPAVGEWAFLDAPFEAQVAPDDAAAAAAGGVRVGGRSWWCWTDGASVERPSQSLHYSRVDEALAGLRAALNEHRPDAILGFSQGATATALLLASLAAAAAAAEEEQEQHLPRLAILIGGFLPRDKAVAATLAAGRPSIPTLFVAGETDALVPPERTRALMECFAGDGHELCLHPGGHFVPTVKSGPFKDAIMAFLEKHA